MIKTLKIYMGLSGLNRLGLINFKSLLRIDIDRSNILIDKNMDEN
jgi:hypothetical protein